MTDITKELLAEAKLKSRVAVHLFLTEYKKHSKTVYCFVEGGEDICFYQPILRQKLTHKKYDVAFYPCNNRDNVLKSYERFDWRKFKRNKVLFFIDRDLSSFLKHNLPAEENIYITDGYSIENSIVSSELIIRHLQEFGHITAFPEKNKKLIQNEFDTLLKSFCITMSDIMIWTINLMRNGNSPKLKNICPKRICKIDNMKISLKVTDLKKEFETNSECKIPEKELKTIRNKFMSGNNYIRFIKGKFLISFLELFFDDLFKNKKTLKILNGCNLQMKGTNSQIENLAHKANCPKTLDDFLNTNISKF